MNSHILQRDNSVLVVIDLQEPFLKAIYQREFVECQSTMLIEAAKVLSVPIIASTQYAARMGGLVEGVASALPEDCQIIDKMSFSCCRQPEFMQALADTGRRQVVICGVETHICVTQTALQLKEHGYNVAVVADAVSSRSAANIQSALHRLGLAGVELPAAESVLYEWLESADKPEFKAILKLVK